MFYGGRIKLAMGEGNPPAISLADRIHCPVAGFFGNEDQNPTPEDVDDYAAALDAAGVDYVFHRYDGAGHAFQNFPTPDRYREQQSEDAWDKVLSFLARTLKRDY
jgi:carboxymethylenebutenolidase